MVFVVAAILVATLSITGIHGLAPHHGQRVVCFMASWGNSLTGEGRFDIPDAEPALHMCTHLVYLFANLDGDSFKIRPQDFNRDFVMGGVKQTAALKKKFPFLKTMISIGGWTDGSIIYSRMAKNVESRATFIKSAVKFVLEHNLDGLDFNWQFPGDRGGSEVDKQNFVLLIKELREEFDKYNLLLSLSVSSFAWRVNLGIDGKALEPYAHFFNVLSYEYHGYWEGKVGPHTAFNATDGYDIIHSVQIYLDMGVAPEKINIGISSYGTTYILEDPNAKIIIGAPVKSYSFKGLYNSVDGFMADNELCKEKEQGGWTEVWDEPSQTPYSISGEKVVTHDNADSVLIKIRYAMEKRLGGIIYYGLEKDDFKGKCAVSKGKYPMLRNIDKSLVQLSSETYGDIYNLLKSRPANYFWSGMKQ